MKPQTRFKISWRLIVLFAMRAHRVVKVHTIEILSWGEDAPHFKVVQFFINLAENFPR